MNRLKMIALAITAITMIAVIQWFQKPQETFSGFRGFEGYFAANPPSDALPAPQDQKLLARHQPRFNLPQGHVGLIGFYPDYIGQGSLYRLDGTLVSMTVDKELLNAVKHEKDVEFVHEPDADQNRRPIVFARVDRTVLKAGGESVPLTFLTYHAVFRNSGVLAGIEFWKEWLFRITGDLNDWHQLDHYTSVSVVLDNTMRPVALMMQQHNMIRTYLIGETVTLAPDGRPVVDVAVRSNELYPHKPGRTLHNAVQYPTPSAVRYLLSGGSKPFMAAMDVTDPRTEAAYDLDFLAHSDAFYTFRGFLGERRMLPGRSGPPGADYNTLPELKPWWRQLASGYWRKNHAGDIERFEETYGAGRDVASFAAAQAKIFIHNVRCLASEDPCPLW